MSVCVSRTICVCTGEKWFRTFVRGTVRTENEIVSVCVSLSSTICVYRTAKWFNPFVRGTFETDSQYNLEKRTATVLRFYLHFSNVRPRNRSTRSNVRPQPFYTFPMLGPLGAAPARLGWTATVLRFQMLLVPDVLTSTAIKCRNQFSVLSVPHHAAQPQALNLGVNYFYLVALL